MVENYDFYMYVLEDAKKDPFAKGKDPYKERIKQAKAKIVTQLPPIPN